MSNLFWHYLIDETDYPIAEELCFIDINGNIELAYWRPEMKQWYNSTFHYLPPIYDDSGGVYPRIVTRWAYVPKGLFN